MKKTIILTATLAALTTSFSALADRDHRLDQRGDRIEDRLDRRGDRIEDRHDKRADKARANGHEKRADHLE
ncbi:MAG TPA: hypothetical protein PLC01_06460, partial [Methylotenera sp.]|nr:hypothetical protein [Methylotenera sp.]